MSGKPQALLVWGSPVRIRKHRRQVGGAFATLLDAFWRGDEPWVVLQLPAGRRTAVPVSWTDLSAELFTRSSAQAELLPAALLELSRYCQGLRRGQRPRSGPKTPTRSRR